MKISKDSAKFAKTLFRLVTADGKISSAKLEKIVKIIHTHPSPKAKEILWSLTNQLRGFERKGQLLVESAFPLEKEQEGKIRSTFEKKLHRGLVLETKVNRDLLGGTKISNADNVWETSVIGSLQNLKGNF